MTKIAKIGKCVACQQMMRLEDDACDKCKALFAVKDSALLKMMRNDPNFLRYILSRLTSPEAKKFITDAFGDPEEILNTTAKNG